ncbi:AMP-binding protein [Rubrobacter xylanophilus]|uniref:AMP-binding protein n=1 Tax=Rubrobacter xylanophilus TaxID=49319 RepID=A0A510HJ46_9ACTN|nr:AMP-binding protein [Rubrobacter xylanophilus]BBL79275.1 AMP-binding protein [Rubrobacter xylanophilus]
MGQRISLTESYWPADESEPILDITLGQLLREVVAEVPDRDALVEGVPEESRRRRWTYSQLLSEAEDVAAALLGRFKPGERIAIMAPNIPEWEILQLGMALSGLIMVTVNPAFKQRELSYILGQSRASALFHVEDYRGTDLTTIIEKIRPELPELREIISISAWNDFVGSGDRTIKLPEVKPEDPVQIQYTSGTTGFPKGAMLNHRGVVNTARFTAERAGLERGGTWVNAMPMYHIGGSVVAAIGTMAHQGKHVLVPGFEPGSFLELFESERGTFSLVVPTMLLAMLNHEDLPKRNLSSLRTIMSGASAVSPALVRRTKAELGCEFSILFGQTELHGVIATTHPSDSPEDQSETVGQPLPQAEVKIVDIDTGEVVPVGEQGEICARGYQTMIGYFGMPEATEEVLEADGWLHTGDLGTMDERGYLRITGRLKDMIIRGGVNIYPREIEDLLAEHPKVASAIVVGVPDETWGEQIAGVIQAAKPDEPPTPEELHEYCRVHLAAHKTPKL